MERVGGLILELSGRIQPVAVVGVVVVLPGLDAAHQRAAGVADLLGGGGEALVEPGAHAGGVGVVDQMLILMDHRAVGGIHPLVFGAGGILIVDAGVGVDVQNGQAVAADITLIEEAGDITLAGLPAVLDVVVQHVQLSVAGAAVGVVAEGGLHQIELGVELIGSHLRKGGIDLIQGVIGARRGGRGPDVAMLTDVQALELQAVGGVGLRIDQRERLRGTNVVGCSGAFRGRLNLRSLGIFGEPGIHVDLVGTVGIRGLSGLGVGAGADAGFDQAGHRAGGIARGGGSSGVVDHHVVALVAAGGVVVNDDRAVDRADRLLQRGSGLKREDRERGQEHADHEHNRQKDAYLLHLKSPFNTLTVERRESDGILRGRRRQFGKRFASFLTNLTNTG